MTDKVNQPVARPEPVAWQWRRKADPWSLDKTFNCIVYATTDDSEMRALYAESDYNLLVAEVVELKKRLETSEKELVDLRAQLSVAETCLQTR